jgi:hypothetical protein
MSTKTLTIIRHALGLAAIGLATVAIGATAEARSGAAFAGQPQNPSDYTCFTNANGRVINSCAATKRFCVPLVVDDANHTVSITVFSPDSNHLISCFAASAFPSGAISNFSGQFTVQNTGIDLTVPLPSVVVPTDGSLFTCCDIPQGARLDSVNW